MTSPTLLSIPELPAFDALVIGSTTAAVISALELRQAGRSVLAISELSYFGSESAGTLRLDSPSEPTIHPLLQRLNSLTPETGLSPNTIKRSMDLALLEAGVGIRYHTRPIGVLRDASGALAGLVLAFRTGWMAVRCGVSVDASNGGLLARLAGVPMTSRALGSVLHWNVLVNGSEKPVHSAARALGKTITVPGDFGTVSLWELTLDRPDCDPLEWPQRLRAGMVDCSIRQSADFPIGAAPYCLKHSDGLAASLSALEASAWQPIPGIILAGQVLPLDESAALALETWEQQVALGKAAAARALLVKLQAAVSPLHMETSGATRGNYTASAAFTRHQGHPLELEIVGFPEWKSCEVAIAGGGTGGAPAGISAARAGADTLLLEFQHGMGGVGTLGLIASYYFGNKVGYTAEFDALIAEADPERVKRATWNPELKMALLHRLLHEAGGRAWMGCFVFGVRMEEARITGLLVSTPYGSGLLPCGAVVDASGNADVAAAAGAPCRWIGREHAGVQGVGLSPRSPGRDNCNSDHSFADDTDCEGVTHAFIRARAKFENEFDVATLLDSRERRQIVGRIELSPLDFLAERTFPDTVFTAKSNFDTHGFTVHPVFMLHPPDKKSLSAHVPLRCMLPLGIEGVVVTGLGMCAHRDAIPVIRMQADVQNQGYAAGIAAAEAARLPDGFAGLAVRGLQDQLVATGILAPEVPGQVDSFPLAPSKIREAVEQSPQTFHDAAVLFAHPEIALPMLLERLLQPGHALDAALVLGMMGRPEAAPILLKAVETEPWDAGWNYRGMGQFGRSMSRLDAMIIALARTGDLSAVSIIEKKICELDADADFSHCRAVALAAVCLRDVRLGEALAVLLNLPGVSGHAELDSLQTVASANPDSIETLSRNVALRELYLARGIFAAGDPSGLGHRILTTYASDLRGPFARHARALLLDGEVPDCLQAA